MFSRSLILTGSAIIALTASAAHAQDASNPNLPPVSAAPQPSPVQDPAPATLSILPGSDVRGADGQILGKLEGAHSVAGAQELKVRGPDGVLRSVPLLGLKPDGDGVQVAWTSDEFQAAPEVQTPSPDAQPMVPDLPPVTPPATLDDNPQTEPDL